MKVADIDELLTLLTNLKDELNVIELNEDNSGSLSRLSSFVMSANSLDSEVLEYFDNQSELPTSEPDTLSINQLSEAQIGLFLKEICELRGLVVLDKYSGLILTVQKESILDEFRRLKSKSVGVENIYSVMRMIEDSVDLESVIRAAVKKVENEMSDEAMKLLLQF